MSDVVEALTEAVDTREAKLPKWAQWKLDVQRSEIRSLKAKLASALGGGSLDDRVVVSPYRATIGLGDHPTVRVKLNSDRVEVNYRYIDVSYDEHYDAVQIRGGESIRVRPNSDNRITVDTVGR